MYGGANLWGTHVPRSFREQDIGDGLIEVVAIFGSMHVGQIKGGLRQSARRIAQGSSIRVGSSCCIPTA